jgi:hypothetical protein
MQRNTWCRASRPNFRATRVNLSLCVLVWTFSIGLGNFAAAQEALEEVVQRGYFSQGLLLGPLPPEAALSVTERFVTQSPIFRAEDPFKERGGFAQIRPEAGQRLFFDPKAPQWQPVGLDNSFIPLHEETSSGQTPDGHTYFAAYIKATEAKNVLIEAEAPLGLRLWMNGTLIQTSQRTPDGKGGKAAFLARFEVGRTLLLFELPVAPLESLAEALGRTPAQTQLRLFRESPSLLGTDGRHALVRVYPAENLDGRIYYAPVVEYEPVSFTTGRLSPVVNVLLFNAGLGDVAPVRVTFRLTPTSEEREQSTQNLSPGRLHRVPFELTQTSEATLSPSVRVRSGDVEKTFNYAVNIKTPVNVPAYLVAGVGFEEQGRVQSRGEQVRALERLFETGSITEQEGVHFGATEAWSPFFLRHPEHLEAFSKSLQAGRSSLSCLYAPVTEAITTPEVFWRNVFYGVVNSTFQLDLPRGDLRFSLVQANSGYFPKQWPQVLSQWGIDQCLSVGARALGFPDVFLSSPNKSIVVQHRAPGWFPAEDPDEVLPAVYSMLQGQRGKLLSFVWAPVSPEMLPMLGPRSAFWATGNPPVYVVSPPPGSTPRPLGIESDLKKSTSAVARLPIVMNNAALTSARGRVEDMEWAQLLARTVARLQDAEAAAVVAGILGAEFPFHEIDYAWRRLIAAHCPWSPRQHAEDRWFALSQVDAFAQDLREASLRYLAQATKSPQPSATRSASYTKLPAVLVFNPTARTQTQFVRVRVSHSGLDPALSTKPTVGSSEAETSSKAPTANADSPLHATERRIVAITEAGQREECAVEIDEKNPNLVHVSFVAHEVPAYGYRLYQLFGFPQGQGKAEVHAGRTETPTWELSLDPKTGACLSLERKEDATSTRWNLPVFRWSNVVRTAQANVDALSPLAIRAVTRPRQQAGIRFWECEGAWEKSARTSSESRAVLSYTAVDGQPYLESRLDYVPSPGQETTLAVDISMPTADYALWVGEPFSKTLVARFGVGKNGSESTRKHISGIAMNWLALEPFSAPRRGETVPVQPAEIRYEDRDSVYSLAHSLAEVFFEKGVPVALVPDQSVTSAQPDGATVSPQRFGYSVSDEGNFPLRIVVGTVSGSATFRKIASDFSQEEIAQVRQAITQGEPYLWRGSNPTEGQDALNVLVCGYTLEQVERSVEKIRQAFASTGYWNTSGDANTPTGSSEPGLALFFEGAVQYELLPEGILRLYFASPPESRTVPREVRLGVTPFYGDLFQARIPEIAELFQHPIQAVSVSEYVGGNQPAEFSFVQVSAQTPVEVSGLSVLSDLRRDSEEPPHPQNGLVLRAVEMSGTEKNLSLTFGVPMLNQRFPPGIEKSLIDAGSNSKPTADAAGRQWTVPIPGNGIVPLLWIPSSRYIHAGKATLLHRGYFAPPVPLSYDEDSFEVSPPQAIPLALAIVDVAKEGNPPTRRKGKILVKNLDKHSAREGLIQLRPAQGWAVTLPRMWYRVEAGEVGVLEFDAAIEEGNLTRIPPFALWVRPEVEERANVVVYREETDPDIPWAVRAEGDAVIVTVENKDILDIKGIAEAVSPAGSDVLLTEESDRRYTFTAFDLPVGDKAEVSLSLAGSGQTGRWVRLWLNDRVYYAHVE